jgi:hypothetical protein
MPVKWTTASNLVISTITDLVNNWHPNLRGSSICVVYRSEPANQGGVPVYSDAKKFPVNLIPLMEENYEFLIWVAKETFESSGRSIQMAMLDHALCHCQITDKGPAIVGHEISEFGAILERHGLWNSALRSNRNSIIAAAQMELPTIEMSTSAGRIATISAADLTRAAERLGPETYEIESD